MKQTTTYLLRWVTGLVMLVIAPAAFAFATVNGVPTGAKADQTEIKLFDSADKPVTPDPAKRNRYGNLSPGGYTVEVVVDGKPVGTRTPIRLEDAEYQLRADSATGGVEIIRRLMRQQQQQQSEWGGAIYTGWTLSPFSGVFSSTRLHAEASTGLEEDGLATSVELRYLPRYGRSAAGGPLLYLGYTFNSGLGTERLIARVHLDPTRNDSGVGVDEDDSVTMGAGWRGNLVQRVGWEATVGAHRTRVTATALSNESSGGGPFNRFSTRKTLWGPVVSAGLTLPVYATATGRPVLGTLRYSALWMKDVDASGVSGFGFDYNARIDGGWQHRLQAGIIF